jgi:hypothetical protein
VNLDSLKPPFSSNLVQTSTIAVSENAVFIWDDRMCTLYKLGNGFDGTVVGEKMAVNNAVKAQIESFLL